MTALTNTIVILAVTLAPLASADGSHLLGRYWLPDRDGQVEIYQQGKQFHGRVIAYDIADQRDENNPDPKLRSRLFVGIDMFSGFEYDAKSDRWIDGTIYDPRGGKIYKCRMWFDEHNPNLLMARGYIGLPMLGRTEQFTRVIDDASDVTAAITASN